tara:strand:+ start:2822 stop:3526 length:705 start_codon:yes stop_codon:yes gene_type:complete
MATNAIKRIIKKDIKEVNKLNLNSLGIYIDFNEEDLLKAKAMVIGPKDSLYEGGFLFFNIQFPKNYPFAPPEISYVSRNNIRIHPNIYVGGNKDGGGKVCLSILGTWSGPKWTSIMDITTVLITIQSLLDNNPLHHEPGQENNNGEINKLYNKVIKYETINTLLLKNISDIPNGFECFLQEMHKENNKNKDSISKFLSENINNKIMNISIPFYRIKIQLNYLELYKKYNLYMDK